MNRGTRKMNDQLTNEMYEFVKYKRQTTHNICIVQCTSSQTYFSRTTSVNGINLARHQRNKMYVKFQTKNFAKNKSNTYSMKMSKVQL